ncbi:hypothetical protein ACOMHN_061184 [Nucella lapillus]
MSSTTETSSDNSSKMYTIEASVPTGFESVAAEEAKEMFGTDCMSVRGKITFQTPAERVKDILKLGGIDHCRAQILRIPHFGFTDDGDDCLSRLQLLVKQCDWAEGLEVWSQFFTFPHPIPSCPDTIPPDEQLIDICYSKHMPGHQEPGYSQGKKRKNRRFKRRGDKETEKEKPADYKAATSGTACVEDDAKREESTPQQKENGDSQESPSHPSAQPQGEAAGTGLLTADIRDVPAVGVNGECAENVGDGERRQDQQDAEPPTKAFRNHGHAGDSGEACGAVDCRPSAGPGADNAVSVNGGGDSAGALTCEGPAPDEAGGGDIQGAEMKAEEEGKGSSGAGAGAGKKEARQPPDPTKPVFRVTCKRTGENHSFDSMSAAASLGSAIQAYFGWSVHMTRFNIEVMLSIDNHEVTMGMTLTPESLHKRNLVAFGVTTLRPTICHNMLRMVKIRPGHVVCDPLCGTASISIQGALNFPALQLCGDNHEIAMKKTLTNQNAMDKKRRTAGKGAMMMGAVRWNACHLPLKDGIVDVFVSDLPFGKRVGRKFDNQKLYCRVLDEMARCGKLGARAALLTGDVNNMIKAVQAQKYWTRRRCYSCNIGGISAAVFLLFRSKLTYTGPSPRQMTYQHLRHHPSSPPPSEDPEAASQPGAL